MYKIVQKKVLSEQVKLMVVEAPIVAKKVQAGQFVIVRTDEKAERIPLTVADFDRQKGTITIIFQEVGKSTKQMGLLEVGEGFENVAGPLGHATEVENFGTVVVVGGGVGIAPLFPITRALKEAGNKVLGIIGARNYELLFWEDRMAEFCDELTVMTDDGSKGRKGLVTEPLKEILEREKIDKVWAIGPGIMMKFCAATTQPFDVPTIVSLNTIMIDGTGMCGGCRITTKDAGAKFVCVDGPEFDAQAVDWDNLLQRMTFYKTEEKESLDRWETHRCKLEPEIKKAGF